MNVRLTRRGVVAAALCAPLAGLAGCELFRRSHEWNYRLTLVVDTPSGERRASSVYRAVANPTTSVKRSDGYSMTGYGEAVALFLPDAHGGKGAWLFAERLAHWESAALPATAYRETLRAMGARAVHLNPVADYDWVPMMDDLHDLPPAALDWNFRKDAGRPNSKEVPRLLTFEDVADPLSVRLVDPDDLAATFGPGHRLKAMLVEMTHDEPRYGRAASILPWLSDVRGSLSKVYKLAPVGTRAGKFRTPHEDYWLFHSLGDSSFMLRPSDV